MNDEGITWEQLVKEHRAKVAPKGDFPTTIHLSPVKEAFKVNDDTIEIHAKDVLEHGEAWFNRHFYEVLKEKFKLKKWYLARPMNGLRLLVGKLDGDNIVVLSGLFSKPEEE